MYPPRVSAPHRPSPLGVARLLPWLALATFVFGVGWRVAHMVFFHPATHFIYSDMFGYHQQAVDWSRPTHLNIVDTLYPPGAGLFYAAWHRLDPSDRLVGWVMALASSLVPLLVAVAARRLYGRNTSFVACILCALYFPFVDYFGFFLSEGPFIFFVYLSFASLAIAVTSTGRHTQLAALTTGILLACAATIRTVGLAWGMGLIVLLLFWAWRGPRELRRAGVRVALLLGMGMLVVLMPVAARTAPSLNEGRFCAVSTNGPMNVVLGHVADVHTIRWDDRVRNTTFIFGSPVMTQLGAKADISVPFGAYDGAANMRYARRLLADDPALFLWLSIDQAAFLFGGTIPWPSSHTPWRRAMILSQYAFYLTILLPALFTLRRRARALFRLDASARAELLLILPLVGAAVTSFMTLGEPRYRIPCDGLLMILAAREYVRWLRLSDPDTSPEIIVASGG